MLGDIAAGPAYRFSQWLELVRKRSGKYRSSGFPNRPQRADSMPLRFLIDLFFFLYWNVALIDENCLIWGFTSFMLGLTVYVIGWTTLGASRWH